jgi:hypothetical protein
MTNSAEKTIKVLGEYARSTHSTFVKQAVGECLAEVKALVEERDRLKEELNRVCNYPGYFEQADGSLKDG